MLTADGDIPGRARACPPAGVLLVLHDVRVTVPDPDGLISLLRQVIGDQAQR